VIAIPAGGKVTLSLSYYFAHDNSSSPADFFRVSIAGATTQAVTQAVIEDRGGPTNQDAAFVRRTVDITGFAGQTVQVLIEAGDLEAESLIEAAVDDVVIESQ
jgi:hypothetical protein